MDENEFRRVLNLFPIVRSRDYYPESDLSRESTSRTATDEMSEWQDAWGEEDKKVTESQGVDRDDPFWEKLKLAAESKVGATEAEKFCRAFQTVHKKLVCEELRKDASPSYNNLTSLD
ncbi:hypothetical protein AQUCO_00400686v1 [Aquilegia coerulea]|uniref:Uncharacterized protein n=1 Tax=Aquilegia coerulea TaxID=218851 RepID=A0A2G5EW82_AQUCA|nr:hypothetical protein AQUCO_00400686v1 [Aquilegia coerulea]